MARTILMGDPAFFGVHGGANPHTRNVLGVRKTVDAERARYQWHQMGRTLVGHGVEVCVIEPHPAISGLVYPANAGFLHPLQGVAGERKKFYLSHLLPTRAAERDIYRPFIQSLGYETVEIASRFEGEADFFPGGDYMLFTHGTIERQRFAPRFGIPPWKRIYGFRSDAAASRELQNIVGRREIIDLELTLEAHYHGDTVLCSFGPNREYLLAYMEGLSARSQAVLRDKFSSELIPLSVADAQLYAANSFQVEYQGKLYLFMPEGVTDGLIGHVRERGVEPVLMDVSEFLAKGGGSIKCMILDLGPSEEQAQTSSAMAFRKAHLYQKLKSI